jgi:G3E family GTPase
MRLLANGCLCCETRGDLVDTLTTVAHQRASGEIPRFDRVLIETTGLADPVPLIRTIVSDRELCSRYGLDTVACVVDAVHALSQLATLQEPRKQIAVSDVLLLSKTDLVGPANAREIEAAVTRLAPGAAVHVMLHGQTDPAFVFRDGAAERDLARWVAAVSPLDAAGRDHEHFRHSGDIRSFCVTFDGQVSNVALGTWLSMLASFRGSQLLRVKGVVNVSGAPYVINAVQTVVHKPAPLDRWPGPDRRTRLVFIVRGLDRVAIDRSLAALAMTESIGAAAGFDPAAYARFREAAEYVAHDLPSGNMPA